MTATAPDLDDRQRSVLRVLLEHSVIAQSRTFRMARNGLRFRALIPTDKSEEVLPAVAALVEEGWVSSYREDADALDFVLSERFNIPTPSDDELRVLLGNVVKRVLLSHLYERYKEVRHRKAAMTQLVPLAVPLEVKKEDLQFFAQELIDGHFIEYEVMDGGQYTCSLTEFGAAKARLTATLVSTFPGVDMTKLLQPMRGVSSSASKADPKRVFVVHGRNLRARDEMFAFLRAVGLEPLEWNEGVIQSGKATPYVGEILDEMFRAAQAVVVLLTGDDLAKLDDRLLISTTENPEPLAPQARANVIFEAGRAFASHADRTILVEMGELRPFSDVLGRHTVRLNNTAEMRQALVDRLKVAGCEVKTEGKSGWYSVGDFDSCVLAALPEAPSDLRVADAAFKEGLIKILADAREVFVTGSDFSYSLPAYLQTVQDEVCGLSAVFVYEQWFFLARQNGGLTASSHDLVAQVQELINRAEAAVTKSAAFAWTNRASEVYGQMVPRFNEFAVTLQRYLEANRDIHGRPTSIQRLPTLLPAAAIAPKTALPAAVPLWRRILLSLSRENVGS